MAYTLKLDAQWDLYTDDAGSLAIADGAYATAQNVACACRLFTEDAFYNPERGIPHFVADLGVKLNPAVARAELQAAALSVDGVAEAQLRDVRLIEGTGEDRAAAEGRVMTGDLRITLATGESYDVTI